MLENHPVWLNHNNSAKKSQNSYTVMWKTHCQWSETLNCCSFCQWWHSQFLGLGAISFSHRASKGFGKLLSLNKLNHHLKIAFSIYLVCLCIILNFIFDDLKSVTMCKKLRKGKYFFTAPSVHWCHEVGIKCHIKIYSIASCYDRWRWCQWWCQWWFQILIFFLKNALAVNRSLRNLIHQSGLDDSFYQNKLKDT